MYMMDEEGYTKCSGAGPTCTWYDALRAIAHMIAEELHSVFCWRSLTSCPPPSHDGANQYRVGLMVLVDWCIHGTLMKAVGIEYSQENSNGGGTCGRSANNSVTPILPVLTMCSDKLSSLAHDTNNTLNPAIHLALPNIPSPMVTTPTVQQRAVILSDGCRRIVTALKHVALLGVDIDARVDAWIRCYGANRKKLGCIKPPTGNGADSSLFLTRPSRDDTRKMLFVTSVRDCTWHHTIVPLGEVVLEITYAAYRARKWQLSDVTAVNPAFNSFINICYKDGTPDIPLRVFAAYDNHELRRACHHALADYTAARAHEYQTIFC
ncbi:hypothetical protein BDZ89DRAFT_1048598 [Hymenopellis radicata]|nr:hypothetical protein BDZ89DRAFT_1048598 [Hymenopellis radicata]